MLAARVLLMAMAAAGATAADGTDGTSFFVAGASGATGQAVVHELVGRDSVTRVVAAVRNKSKAAFPSSPKLEIVEMISFDHGLMPSMEGIDVCVSAIGTSRANEEVQRRMDEMGKDDGFEFWLRRVDVEINETLAAYAQASGVRHFVRISARHADPARQGGGFNVYWRMQGVADEAVSKIVFPRGITILRPGRLDRGEELRAKRPWEVERHAAEGPGLSVAVVAKKAVDAAERAIAGPSTSKPSVNIIEHDDISRAGKNEL